MDCKSSLYYQGLRELTENYFSEVISILFKNVGYSKRSAENYGRIIQDIFLGMNIGKAIKFFKENDCIVSYKDARVAYMEEQGLNEMKPY